MSEQTIEAERLAGTQAVSDTSHTNEASGLWARLKDGTRAAHEQLDKRIMQAGPFESRARYCRFLLVQHDFHAIVSPLYQHLALTGLLPDLAGRDRLPAIENDLSDLGVLIPAHDVATPSSIDIPYSLGWLYVAEGSNLGAAFLLKAAQKLDLSEGFGARHLAPAKEGRGLHWKTFTAALDNLSLSAADQLRAIEGANHAFSKVRDFVEIRMFEPGV